MMYLRRRSVFFIFLFLCSLPILGNNASSKARDILEEATKKQDQRSYSTISKSPTSTIEIKQQENSDGTVFMQATFSSGNSYMSNNQGRFSILHDYQIIIKENYPFDPYAVDNNDLAKFELAEADFEGISCYLITKTVPENKIVYKRYLENMPQDLRARKNSEQLRGLFKSFGRKKEIYYIGKDDKFIYASADYSFNGSLITRRTNNEVNLNPDFPQKIFELPKKYKLIIANSEEERHQIVRKQMDEKLFAENKNDGSVKQKFSRSIGNIPAFIDRNFETISKVGTYFFALLGIGLVLVIVLFKIKSRKV